MANRSTRMLIFLFFLFSTSVWIASPYSELHIDIFERNIDWNLEVRQGLDLQGGSYLLLEIELSL